MTFSMAASHSRGKFAQDKIFGASAAANKAAACASISGAVLRVNLHPLKFSHAIKHILVNTEGCTWGER